MVRSVATKSVTMIYIDLINPIGTSNLEYLEIQDGRQPLF